MTYTIFWFFCVAFGVVFGAVAGAMLAMFLITLIEEWIRWTIFRIRGKL